MTHWVILDSAQIWRCSSHHRTLNLSSLIGRFPQLILLKLKSNFGGPSNLFMFSVPTPWVIPVKYRLSNRGSVKYHVSTSRHYYRIATYARQSEEGKFGCKGLNPMTRGTLAEEARRTNGMTVRSIAPVTIAFHSEIMRKRGPHPASPKTGQSRTSLQTACIATDRLRPESSRSKASLSNNLAHSDTAHMCAISLSMTSMRPPILPSISLAIPFMDSYIFAFLWFLSHHNESNYAWNCVETEIFC
jgi:hypothetical protein